MTDKAIQRFTWASRILTLLGLLAGVLAVADKLPTVVHDYAALAVALLGVLARWCEQQLPPSRKPSMIGPTMLGVVLLLMLIAPACKAPLATAYRGHALLLTARDGAGETLAKVQRVKMLRCEAEHKPPAAGWKVALKGCYEDVRAPLVIWIQHVRPLLTACAAGLWLALESVYIAGQKKLDKASKATAAACATFTAAEIAIKAYADKLGSLGPLILGAVAGGKMLVCP